MKIEDVPMSYETTFPWIVDPEGTRTPCIRIHKESDNPDNDTIIPLDRDTTFAIIGDLCGIYTKLTKGEEPPFERDPLEGLCEWPVCLTGEQGALLAEEIRQEDLTGKPCRIYLDKYPQDQREVCKCSPPVDPYTKKENQHG